MRRTTLHALVLTALAGCYNPDYSSKPCADNNGCPSSYFCDTSRAAAGAIGTCTMGTRSDGGGGTTADMSAADMSTFVPPLTLTEYMIPAGTFILGSDLMDVANSGDAPAYQRTMPALCVEETEVTVASYKKCVDAGKCSAPIGGNATGCNYGVSGREQHPVNCVQYSQAYDFCEWIGRRLPTEAEWEYAANGPTTSTGEKYPYAGTGGSFVAAKACFNNNGTCPVGSKVRTYQGSEVASAPGFYDLVGNVWEWTSSEYCSYIMTSPDRTCGIPAWVVRGGSGYDIDSRLMRSTIRLRNAKTASDVNATYMNYWVNNAGFRCFGDVSGTNTCIK